MMAAGELAVAAALCWLATTLVFQFRPLSLRFQSLDRVGLLPRWLFFTQHAGTTVLAVAFRVRDAGGFIGAWEPVPFGAQWRWWHAIFYPDHALARGLSSAAYRLSLRADRGDSAEEMAQSQAFAVLRNHLLRQHPGRALQFAVLRNTAAGGEPEPVFISGFIGG